MNSSTVQIKDSLKRFIIETINRLGVSSKYAGAPLSISTTAEWVGANLDKTGSFFREIYPTKKIMEQAPVTLEQNVHSLYTREYERVQPAAFVAAIPAGRVWGRNGIVITPDDMLLGDISREFGKYGGCFNKELSIFKRVRLGRLRKLKGRIAVAASAGSYNYHHWIYDTLPRLWLLKKAGLFPEIDRFIIDYTGLPFQQESLAALGISPEKIICCNDAWKFHIQADQLMITSLPARLGTISDWTIEFLRDIFLERQPPAKEKRIRLYLSRKKAVSRKLVNENEIIALLEARGYRTFFAENHSIRETASVFSQCESIIGVHGSGFANLAFCDPDTKIIDLLPPKHLDPYYWIISNRVHSQYAYLFGNGDRLAEETDLVQHKIDEDLIIDIQSLISLMGKLALHD